jgi:hypothetical protein
MLVICLTLARLDLFLTCLYVVIYCISRPNIQKWYAVRKNPASKVCGSM